MYRIMSAMPCSMQPSSADTGLVVFNALQEQLLSAAREILPLP